LVVAGTLAAAAAFAFVLDLVKVPVFARLGIAQSRAPAGSPEGGQFQSAGTANQAATGGVSTRWQIPAAAVVLVVLAFGGGWLYWSTHRTATVRYATQKIELGSIVRTVTASGGVVPSATALVGARVSGVIQALSCAADTKVKAGQICAKLDPRPYQTVVDQDNADLAAAEDRREKDKTDLAHAKAAFERHEARSKRRAISRKALDNSHRTYEQAQTQTKLDEATVAELQAALHAAETNLGDTDIVSPIDGTVVSRNVAIGQIVAVGSETAPLFLVAADLTVLHVDANVRKNDIGEVNLGDKATFTVGPFANRLFAGEVTQIGPSPQTIENVVTYDVVITASNPDLLVEPGMTATIRIVVDRRDNVLRAPDQALRYSPAGHAAPSDSSGARTPLAGWPQVWTLREGRPTAVPVQLGLQDGVYTEIVKGDLKPGDDLIISESGSRVNQ
jgi:RND family efflux transporter MFP subunit